MSLSNIEETIAGGPGDSVRPALGDGANPGQSVQLLELTNHFFEGNMKVSGLLVGKGLQRCLALEPEGHRYLPPNNHLNDARLFKGLRPEALSGMSKCLPLVTLLYVQRQNPQISPSKLTASWSDER